MTTLLFACRSCNNPIGIGAATIYDGQCRPCHDNPATLDLDSYPDDSYEVTEHLLPGEADVIDYTDLISDQDVAILAKLAAEEY